MRTKRTYIAVIMTFFAYSLAGQNSAVTNHEKNIEAQTYAATGTIEGHEYVDLGLSVKWATCNVGANRPEDFGCYFAWGEIVPKLSYSKANCSTLGKDYGDIGGNPLRDAATANWFGTWQMPTEAEVNELIDNCTWTWTTKNGQNGRKVTSKKMGNQYFFPLLEFG